MQRAVQLLICVKNDVCVYVTEKCELILGGACATYSHKGELCFTICRYLCIVMLHAVEMEISLLLIDGILDSVTAGSAFPGWQAFAGGQDFAGVRNKLYVHLFIWVRITVLCT